MCHDKNLFFFFLSFENEFVVMEIEPKAFLIHARKVLYHCATSPVRRITSNFGGMLKNNKLVIAGMCYFINYIYKLKFFFLAGFRSVYL